MLLHKDNPLMRKVMPFFDFDNPPIDPVKLKEELIDRMFEEGGVGLAANQIGYEYRAFVMKGANKEQSMFFVNPEIIEFSKETVVLEEGCLTGGCEGIFANITRPEKVVCRWQDETGEVKELEFSGMTARCLQHELDHLNGILFIDYLSRLKLERAMKKKQKREKEYARIRKQFVQFAREHHSKNPKLSNEGTVSETNKVSSD